MRLELNVWIDFSQTKARETTEIDTFSGSYSGWYVTPLVDDDLKRESPIWRSV